MRENTKIFGSKIYIFITFWREPRFINICTGAKIAGDDVFAVVPMSDIFTYPIGPEE